MKLFDLQILLLCVFVAYIYEGKDEPALVVADPQSESHLARTESADENSVNKGKNMNHYLTIQSKSYICMLDMFSSFVLYF